MLRIKPAIAQKAAVESGERLPCGAARGADGEQGGMVRRGSVTPLEADCGASSRAERIGRPFVLIQFRVSGKNSNTKPLAPDPEKHCD
jgi:hypothetical protein